MSNHLKVETSSMHPTEVQNDTTDDDDEVHENSDDDESEESDNVLQKDSMHVAV